ncbi:MAG: hypothetical protein ACJA2S_002354 [Cyclobacteriaceae bacterium]|jgi:hypothetical protein
MSSFLNKNYTYYLLPIFILLLLSCHSKKVDKVDYEPIFITEHPSEVDVRFYVNNSHGVIYSSNISGKYQLYQWKNGLTKQVSNNDAHVFRPFIYLDEINGLKDSNGSEEFSLLKTPGLNFGKRFDFIIPSSQGNFLLSKVSGSDKVVLTDIKNSKNRVISEGNRFNKGAFSADESKLVFSTENQINLSDLVKNKRFQIATMLPGKKYNPSIYNDKVFYSSNVESEFFQIYESSTDSPDAHILLVASSNDLRLPKFDGEYLYYIEIERGSYVLKRLKYPSGQSEKITKSGVVYNFDFIGKDSVAFIYSDLLIPRGVFLFNDNLVTPISNIDSVENNIEMNFLEKGSNRSSAFIMKPRDIPTKGIVCFFHGAPDFSPRWDPILNAICNNGYTVIVPNYPGTFGYGKSFQKLTLEEAVRDMITWKNYLVKEYQLPVHYLGLSQGSNVMEMALLIDPNNVMSFVSCFGISDWNFSIDKVSGMYILGENDPIVPFEAKTNKLDLDNFEVLSFADEGHGLKSTENERITAKKIIVFMNKNN